MQLGNHTRDTRDTLHQDVMKCLNDKSMVVSWHLACTASTSTSVCPVCRQVATCRDMHRRNSTHAVHTVTVSFRILKHIHTVATTPSVAIPQRCPVWRPPSKSNQTKSIKRMNSRMGPCLVAGLLSESSACCARHRNPMRVRHRTVNTILKLRDVCCSRRGHGRSGDTAPSIARTAAAHSLQQCNQL